jgi:tryptophanyl-tRNA synthetase
MQVRIFSGIQPSGTPHIGNYLGALKQWAESQNQDAFYCVVDLHALTLDIEPSTLQRQTRETLAVLLAVGLDPSLCTVFIQSHVPYHSMMSWLLECVASYGELTRMTQFKEKAERQGGFRAGLFTYPVLMASDILLYHAVEIPVGDDQRPPFLQGPLHALWTYRIHYEKCQSLSQVLSERCQCLTPLTRLKKRLRSQ